MWEGSVSVDKGGVNELHALTGLDLGSVEGNNNHESEPMPHQDVELYTREEAISFEFLSPYSVWET